VDKRSTSDRLAWPQKNTQKTVLSFRDPEQAAKRIAWNKPMNFVDIGRSREAQL
jgi:hypothetical protein